MGFNSPQDLSSPFIAGSNPAVCFSSISPVDRKLPETAQMTECESTRERYLKNRNCSAMKRSFFFIGNVLFALLKNGYRVSNISAKSSLSADMCDRLSF